MKNKILEQAKLLEFRKENIESLRNIMKYHCGSTIKIATRGYEASIGNSDVTELCRTIMNWADNKIVQLDNEFNSL